MNLLKRLSILLFIPIFLSTSHLGAIAPTELDHQMKDFRHQVRIYFQCLRDGKCLTEKQKNYLKSAFYIGLWIGGILLLKKYWPASNVLEKRKKLTAAFDNFQKAGGNLANAYVYLNEIRQNYPNSPAERDARDKVISAQTQKIRIDEETIAIFKSEGIPFGWRALLALYPALQNEVYIQNYPRISPAQFEDLLTKILKEEGK